MPFTVRAEIFEVPRAIARRTSSARQARDKLENRPPDQIEPICPEYLLYRRFTIADLAEAIQSHGGVLSPDRERRRR